MTNSQSQNVLPSQPLPTPNLMNADNKLQEQLIFVVNPFKIAYMTTLQTIVANSCRVYNVYRNYALYRFHHVSRNYEKYKIRRSS